MRISSGGNEGVVIGIVLVGREGLVIYYPLFGKAQVGKV